MWLELDPAVTTPRSRRGADHNSLEFQQSAWSTIPAKIITEMRGADLIVFRINLNRSIRNLMRFQFFSN